MWLHNPFSKFSKQPRLAKMEHGRLWMVRQESVFNGPGPTPEDPQTSICKTCSKLIFADQRDYHEDQGHTVETINAHAGRWTQKDFETVEMDALERGEMDL